MIVPKNLDQWILRVKDLIFILTFIWGIFLFTGKLQALPEAVAMHEGRLVSLEKCQIEMTTTMKHVSKTLDNIQGLVERHLMEGK